MMMDFTIDFNGAVELFLSSAVLLWAFCRAKYMSRRTSYVDQFFLIMLGIGTAAHVLIPICRLLKIPIENGLLFWHGPAFWIGLAGWLILPTVRRKGQHEPVQPH